MQIPKAPHRWAVTPRRAIAIQRALASRVRRSGRRHRLRFVAGVDNAFTKDGALCIAGVVIWDAHSGGVLEERVAVRELRFPYVPGLLSFREAPAILAALRKLQTEPDVLMCDGHGLAHPRRFGIACHIGVLCDSPSIGCAKSRLVGAHREPGRRKGATAELTADGEVIGCVVRTQHDIRPVYVSVGHLLDLQTARQVVLESATKYRLEPTRLADKLVGRVKKGLTFTS